MTFTVGVTADRRADEQGLMLTRLGLRVVHGAALATTMVVDDGPLRQVTERLISQPPDFVVANTGIGIRSWVGAATSWNMADALISALARARILARGPKAAGALKIAGLDVWWRAPTEQLVDVGAHLLAQGVAGTTIAFQLHGQDDDGGVIDALRAAGAEVVEVPVYRWSVPADHQPALRLIEMACEGGLDAVTFTSGPAARNLVALADTVGLASSLVDALNGDVLTVCVGPVSAGYAADVGIVHSVIPEHWRLGAMVKLVADELGRRERLLTTT